MNKLKELLTAAEKATPGNWVFTATKDFHVGEARYGGRELFLALDGSGLKAEDCRFVSSAKNAIPDLQLLLSRYEKLVEAAKTARPFLPKVSSGHAKIEAAAIKAARLIDESLRDIEGE